jgi:hypothetical protein
MRKNRQVPRKMTGYVFVKTEKANMKSPIRAFGVGRALTHKDEAVHARRL